MLVVVDLKDFVMEVEATKIVFLRGAAMDPPLPFGDDPPVSLATLISMGCHEVGGQRAVDGPALRFARREELSDYLDNELANLVTSRPSKGVTVKVPEMNGGAGHADIEKTARLSLLAEAEHPDQSRLPRALASRRPSRPSG
ncbi:MAG TPA: hypothetical protein VD978_31455 [Azospirillum sp.]|nr:hypothetical protein [Azospirillum sp.]